MLNKIYPNLIDIPQYLIIDKSIEQNTTLLNGKLVKLETDLQDVISPIAIKHGTELKSIRLGSHPLMNHQQAIEALNSTSSAFNGDTWKNKSSNYRIKCVKEFLDNFSKLKDSVVKMLIWENCKPLQEAENEFQRTIEYIEQSIEEYKKIESQTNIQNYSGFSGKILNTPIGIVISMGPSNYPIYESYSLCIPALLIGNTVLMKIPRYGSLLHNQIIELLQSSFPKGVINVIYGKNEDTINPIMQTGEIDMLAYMGSNMFVEPLILSHPKPYRIKKLLGLDAKNPAIVLKDCDLDYIVKEIVLGALAFNGQRCAAIKIIFAHSKIYDKLVEEIKNEIEKQIIGMPWTEDVRITPIFDKNRILYLKTLFEDAMNKGAINNTTDGGKINHTFFYPTLLSNVNSSMRIYTEEQFGPIVPIVRFDDIKEPLEYVQNSEFGQQISIFGNNSKEISKLASFLQYQCGRVNINTKCQRGPDIFPFTGKKSSGMGELSINSTLKEFIAHSVVAGKENDITLSTLERI